MFNPPRTTQILSFHPVRLAVSQRQFRTTTENQAPAEQHTWDVLFSLHMFYTGIALKASPSDSFTLYGRTRRDETSVGGRFLLIRENRVVVSGSRLTCAIYFYLQHAVWRLLGDEGEIEIGNKKNLNQKKNQSTLAVGRIHYLFVFRFFFRTIDSTSLHLHIHGEQLSRFVINKNVLQSKKSLMKDILWYANGNNWRR